MVDYRPISEERVDEFRAFVTYAFRPESGPYDPEEADELPPPARIGERRGVFAEDSDDLLAVCRHYWLDAQVAGETVPTAGLSAVATPPENRRRGLVRSMLRESLAEYHERGVPLSVLWPFRTPFYRQFGWATCNKVARHRLAPEALRFADPRETGRVRELSPDDWPAMADVLAAHGADYELTLDRSEEWWRTRVFHGWEQDPYVYGWTDDEGDLRGYVVYVVEEGDTGRELETYDLAFADREAERQLYRFLADHDSQVETVELYGPAETTLLDRVDDPEDVTSEIRAGPMCRLVDVPSAMAARPVPDDATAALTLDIADPLVDRNDGRFRLRVADGRATCEPVDSTGRPDIELGVGPLAQLFVGYRDAAELVTAGDCTVANGDVTAALDAVFPTRDVFLREGF